MAFFSKTNVMIKFLQKAKKRQHFRQIFRRKYFESQNIGPWSKMNRDVALLAAFSTLAGKRFYKFVKYVIQIKLLFDWSSMTVCLDSTTKLTLRHKLQLLRQTFV
jgi:hypothetical protein